MPCRFLTMVSHLVLLLTILLARDDYVKACLPFDFEEDAFGRKDVELVRNYNSELKKVARTRILTKTKE